MPEKGSVASLCKHQMAGATPIAACSIKDRSVEPAKYLSLTRLADSAHIGKIYC